MEDEHQGGAGLGSGVGAQRRDLAGDGAGIFRHHLAEAVALDGDLLPGFDPVVQPDQMLDESAMGRHDGSALLPTKTPVLARCVPSGRRRCRDA